MIYQVTSWSTSMLAILLAAGGAIWVARKGEREAPLHGFLVGLVAALILFIFNPDAPNFFQGAYRGKLELLVRALLTFVLMVAVGWLGGVLGSRGREKS
jgi:putative membrane protein (TIGR04086 family)